MKVQHLLLMLAMLAFPPLANAADASASTSSQPVDITADKTLEWHRSDLQYIARGNAVVKQGDAVIRADVITADYHDTKSKAPAKDGKSAAGNIYRVTAVGHVRIEDRGNTAVGDKAVYDLETGLATLTGDDLKMTSQEQTVTAKDRFEYAINDGRAKAVGDARLVRGADTLYSDAISAVFSTGADGKRALESADADGHVRIVTPNETLTGDRGHYDVKASKAVVTGRVTIMRGENVLNGARAEVDMATNVSRLFGSSVEDGQTGGRVHGVFYPGSETPKSAPAP